MAPLLLVDHERAALRHNQDVPATHFDTHQTIKHLTQDNSKDFRRARDTFGETLLKPLPARPCAELDVTPGFCAALWQQNCSDIGIDLAVIIRAATKSYVQLCCFFYVVAFIACNAANFTSLLLIVLF